MDKCSVRGVDLAGETPALLGRAAMAASSKDTGDLCGDPANPLVHGSGNASEEDDDDDVVFIESIHPPSISPTVGDQRSFTFVSSKKERPRGDDSVILPSRDLASQKGNVSETIVIDDEEDIETNGREERTSSHLTEWGLPGTKHRTKDVDFSTSSLSRSKTKTAVGPFNPGRMSVAGDAFQNGESATHHSPDSWISQSASFPRNQKQPGVESLSPVAFLPKQIFQPSAQQQPAKPAKITCANCRSPLQKGQTAYQRKGSAHLFCSTTCLSSFSHKRTRKTRSVMCKKDTSTKKPTTVPPVESSKSFQEFRSTSCLPPCEDNQNLRKGVSTKSRCAVCCKLAEV
ncbi:zinc finger MYM-type protein 5 [Carlito syrichta]|uniref:Zinc finger MYM-type protein 5 n=1 Tax=Carlito syrichta TaxID=1868482 RepID=A0A3Q0DYD8_CARSF|nr:zinc finger MYM-type protein 5 [Carlito syrichta]